MASLCNICISIQICIPCQLYENRPTEKRENWFLSALNIISRYLRELHPASLSEEIEVLRPWRVFCYGSCHKFVTLSSRQLPITNSLTILNIFQVNKALRIYEQFQIYNIDKQFVTWKQGIFDLRFAWKAEVKTKNQIHYEVWRPRMWNPIQGLRSSEQINAEKMFQLRKHFTRRGLRHRKFLLKISLLFLMC